MNPMKAFGVGFIRLYRVLFAWLPDSCRFEPTCSRYTEQAIVRYGLLRGSLMGARRIFEVPSLEPRRLRPGPLTPPSPAQAAGGPPERKISHHVKRSPRMSRVAATVLALLTLLLLAIPVFAVDPTTPPVGETPSPAASAAPSAPASVAPTDAAATPGSSAAPSTPPCPNPRTTPVPTAAPGEPTPAPTPAPNLCPADLSSGDPVSLLA